MNESSSTQQHNEDDRIDFEAIYIRLRRGLPLIAGFAALGLAIAVIAHFAVGSFLNVSTSTRVVFSFPGFEKGEYPDNSKFQPDDLRSPEIVAEALKRKGMETSEAVQSKVRAALNIEGIIPDSIIKERDKLRASGQTPRLYVPDEYTLTLSLPRTYPLTSRQREILLNEIVSIYQEKFTRTYVAMPINFGKAFDALGGADYFDYELVLSQESQNISAFLMVLAGFSPTSDNTLNATASRSFRSPRTNLSFSDLLKQNQLFIQIRLNETLGLIREYGLSKDRHIALLKMDYFLKILGDEENKATEEEKVVLSLLQQTQERMQNYVLGVMSQAGQQRPDSPIVDQGLRKALESSLNTRRIQSQKAILQERRDNMDTFVKSNAVQKTEAIAQLQKSLDELKMVYDQLMGNIRITYEDFQNQQYGNAIRISMQTKTDSFYRGLAMAGIAGLCIGMATGLGLSLLGIGPGRPQKD